MNFSGQHVVVTGASRGLGLGIARAFAAAGADLTAIAEDAAIDRAAAEIGSGVPGRIAALRIDITDRAGLLAAFADIPPIDVLINNAGLERLTPVGATDNATAAVFEKIIDVNVKGSYWVTQAALPRMRNGGRIVFTSSIWGKSVEAEFSAYCASKHAVIGLTRTLARELGPRGITVNAVCPGWVRTESSMRSLKTMSEHSGRAESDLLAEIIAGQVLDGLMTPADIAGPYLFLASPLAANITGQALNIDRGEVMI